MAQDTPGTVLHNHRVEWLRDLGFSEVQATDLAVATDNLGFPVSMDAIRKTVRRGCSIEVAYEIFRAL